MSPFAMSAAVEVDAPPVGRRDIRIGLRSLAPAVGEMGGTDDARRVVLIGAAAVVVIPFSLNVVLGIFGGVFVADAFDFADDRTGCFVALAVVAIVVILVVLIDIPGA